MDYLKANAPFWKREEKPDGNQLGRGAPSRRRGRCALDQILMAKRAKPARTRPRCIEIQKPRAGELRTLLDFVRYAVSRFVEAKLVFAHGTTDPVAEAAFLVCETLHLHPDQFETFAGARVTAAEAKADSRPDRPPHRHAKTCGLPGQQDLHARLAVLCRRARHRAALLHRRIAGVAFRRRNAMKRGSLIDDPGRGRRRARPLHRLGLPCDPRQPAFSECSDRRRGYFQGRAGSGRAQPRGLRS